MMLLSGHSAVPERKVPLESMSLTIKERDSTAEMVPADMTGIDVNSWLQDDTEPGRGIVWRVKSISNAYNTDTPKVSMEHAINLLKDRILFGEVKPSTITGNSSSTTCTALQAIRYILSQQSDWILDNFEYTNVYGAYKFDGDTLYDALVTVSNSLPDCWWSYDMNVYPFRLSITRKEDDPACEMRASRNLRTISKTIDKSGMFTRFYPIGYDDLQLPEKYIDRNTSVYGVICKTETNTAFDSVSELRGWANERLHDHAEPVVTITVEALELSAATGEAMDHLLLGAVCRVPLTEYNTTLLERITQISIPDKISQPEVVKLTLCNSRTDVSTVIAEILKSSSKSSRASTRQSKEDHAWFEDTSEHVSMTAKGIVGVDAKGNPNWTRLSQIVVDGTGIHQMVQGLQGDMVVANTKIEQNEYQITLEAQRATEAEGQLSGRITVEADRITAEVEERQAEGTAMSGRLDVTSSKVGMVVTEKDGEYVIKAAEICVAINDSTGESEAIINADKVYIGNQKSTTVINGKCSLSDVTANVVKARFESITGNITAKGTMIASGFTYSTINGEENVPLSGAFKNCLKSESSGVVELEFTTFAGTKQKVTFNAASAVTLNNPVWTTAAQENPPSNSNTVTVSTSGRPGSQLSKSVALYMSRSDDWDGNIRTVYVSHTDSSAENRVAKITVDASVRYAAGKNAAKVTGPTWATAPSETPSSNSNTATFTTDASSPSAGTPKSLVLLLQRSDNWSGNTRTVYLHHTDSTEANRIAKIDVDASARYTAGKNAAKVTGPTWSTSPSETPSSNSNTATFTTDATTPSAGTPKSLVLLLQRSDSWDGNTRTVYLHHTDSTSTNRVAKIDVDASARYTAGKNAAKVTGPTWSTSPSSTPSSNTNTATFTTDATTPSASTPKSLVLLLQRSDSWSGNTRTVYLHHTDSTDTNRVAKIDVDASARYTAGKNAAKVTGPTWSTSPSSTPSGNSNTATFTTDADTPSGSTPKSLVLLLQRSDSWDGATRTVYLHHTDSTASNRVAKIDVTAPLQDKSGSSNKITSNGTYTPSSGNIGFSKVQVDVPQRSVSGITFNGYGTPYDSSGWKMNITVNAAYSTGGSYSTAVTADVQNVYVLGHDSAHTMRVVDEGNNVISTYPMSFGETLKLWPEVQQYNSSWYYETNPHCIITAPSNPHPTLVKMRCSEAGQVPGQQLFRYRFTVEYTAAQSYTAGNDYNFYK